MVRTWFEVDKNGLAQLIEQTEKGRIISELVQNAFDEHVSEVVVSIMPIPGRPFAELIVTDDSEDGFRNLAHAYTLFAESEKKGNPLQRGRFNLGEKLVLAVCRSATITSTTGSIVFDESGRRRHRLSRSRQSGTEFRAEIRMTREEILSAVEYLKTVLVPPGIRFSVNECHVLPRVPVHAFEATLDTEVADGQGVLRNRSRKTSVEIYEVADGECASIYEMGIPVVVTGDRWHVNVCQKVPLKLNRDNVPPAFLQRLRAAVFNAMHAELNVDDMGSDWVLVATSHPDCSHQAIRRFLDIRFGQNRASYDPTDVEAGKRIQAGGGHVLTGSMLNSKQWAKAKDAGAILPAGRVCPSPKPYSDDPNAPVEDLLPPDEWTESMKNIAAYARFLASELMGVNLQVRMSLAENRFLACYGHEELTFNLHHLGKRWFEAGPSEKVDELLLHEFGHQYSGDHLSDEYHDALCRLGAKFKRLAMTKPCELNKFMKT